MPEYRNAGSVVITKGFIRDSMGQAFIGSYVIRDNLPEKSSQATFRPIFSSILQLESKFSRGKFL